MKSIFLKVADILNELDKLDIDDRLREIEDVAHGEAGEFITLLRKDLKEILDKKD